MKKYIAAFSVFLFISLYGMESVLDVVVTTCDNQQYPLARWQTRESNTLYSLFLKQLKNNPNTIPVCISVPSVSQKELHAYSSAYHQTDFDTYFKYTLTAKQQRLLTIAAGEHARNDNNELIPKLHDVALSMKILSLMCDKAVFTRDLFPFFSLKYSDSPIVCMLDYFRRSTIIHNARNGNFSLTTENYFADGFMCVNNMTDRYNVLPETLVYKNKNGCIKAIFDGFTFPVTSSFSDNNTWEVNHQLQKNDVVYWVTPEHPYGQESDPTVKKVWVCDDANDQYTLLHEVQHVNSIDKIVFSKNGAYLAVSSHGENREGKISLINLELELEGDRLKNDNEISLEGYPGWNSALCFNSTSTSLVAGANKELRFWDVCTGECSGCFELSHAIDSFCFNSDDSRLAIASRDSDGNHFIYVYDTTDFVCLNTIELGGSDPHSISFSPLRNALVVGTDDHALVIDALTGQKIMETERVEYDKQAEVINWVWPILAPQINLLATATTSSIPNNCNVQLWDVTSGELIATLIKNASDLAGIGIVPHCGSIITIDIHHTMTQIHLCDSIYEKMDNLMGNQLKDLTLLQLYCLYRIDQENEQQHKNMMIHRQSFLYDGIKTTPQTVKDTMYDIFHQLKAYGLRFVSFKS